MSMSMAEGDQIVSIWQTPEGSTTEGKMVVSVQLDSDARAISLSASSSASSERQNLHSDRIRGNLRIPDTDRKGSFGSQMVDASFAAGVVGHIQVARIVGGVRPVFDLVQYLDDKGNFIPEVVIEDVKTGLINESQSGTTHNTESGSVAVRSGAELGQDEEMDDIARNTIDGELDVDLAELSLGQRLTAPSGDAQPVASSDSDDEATTQKSKAPRKGQGDASTQDASTAAGCSPDHELLEPLERGARAGNMKGGEGGASSQRATTLIMWLKTVLTAHSGHLMTMPDLVARLLGLHATLSSRLALQDTVLSLSGRLNMVLS
ncbi:hypothetical protein C8R45DRAFT_936506 [Mycena sanguinolenta]|nr:hypothetical protein C8R45DRAFT_936506 [Mycena sanguinolenta]